MIIIHLKGGLGNQLFQYAFARSLSKNLNAELFIDISYFSHNDNRKHVIFGLNPFNIKGIIGYYPYSKQSSIGLNYVSKSNVYKLSEGVKEIFPEDIFDYETVHEIDNYQLPLYLDGYFQQQINKCSNSILTENFFKENSNLIHQDLNYMLPISRLYDKIIDEINKYDSIALHVRHGDYENIPEFGLCSKEYYQKAIDLISSKVKNPKFFIFTEDHEWVKKNLRINFPKQHIFFKEKKDSSCRGYAELLKVMSLCDHFIIANSTFSWWGAFLSQNKNKIIITPTPWFQDRSIIDVDTIDDIDTIHIKNDYSQLFNKSKISVYNLNEKNILLKNITMSKEYEKFILQDISDVSEIILKCNIDKEFNDYALINIQIKTEKFNCLKIYYKTLNEDYCENNSRSLYYYDNDNINHYIIIPKEALLNELLIKPAILNRNIPNKIEIKSIEIKIINSNIQINENFLYNENLLLKNKIQYTLNQIDDKNLLIENLNKQLSDEKIIIYQKQKELEDKNFRINNLSKQLNDKKKNIQQNHRKTTKLHNQLKAQKETINILSKQLKEKQDIIQQNNLEVDNLNYKIQKQKDIIQQNYTKTNNLNKQLKESEKTINKLNKQLLEEKEINQENQQENDKLERKLLENKLLFYQQHDELEDKTSIINHLNEQLEKQKKNLSDIHLEISHINKQLRKEKEKIINLNIQLDDEKESSKNLIKELNEEKKSSKKLTNKLNEEKNNNRLNILENNKLNKQLQDKKETIDNLRKQLEEMNNKNFLDKIFR